MGREVHHYEMRHGVRPPLSEPGGDEGGTGVGNDGVYPRSAIVDSDAGA